MKSILITNTSGGKSSMAQAIIIKRDYGHKFDQVCVYANTGMENDETLEFIDRCDKEYGLNVVWLEAVVHEYGKGNTHRITNFKDAYRIHQYKDPLHPFHAHVKKNGIPNATYPQCSDRLKEQVIESYKKANGLRGVKQALGFRNDESNRAMSRSVKNALEKMEALPPREFRELIPCGLSYAALYYSIDDRKLKSVTENVNDYNLLWVQDSVNVSSKFINLVSDCKKDAKRYISMNITLDDELAVERYIEKIKKYNLVFPMIDWFPMNKDDVNDFWEDQPFNLGLEAHKGNCATCWKKSDRKLYLIALEQPEKFEAFNWFEATYKHVKPNTGKPVYSDEGVEIGRTKIMDRVFFRKHRNSQMIIGEAQLMDAYMLRKLIGANIDDESGCAESCNGYQL